MITSARPISRFAHYETSGNDIYDRAWAERLRQARPDSQSVQLRTCCAPVMLEDRFITEYELITRVLAGDRHAALWFARRFERLISKILKEMPIHSHERRDVFQQVFVKLREHDCLRLRQWHARGKGRLTSYLSTIVRRTAFEWMRTSVRLNRRDCTADYAERESSSRVESNRSVSDQGNTTVVVDTEVLPFLREQRRAVRRTVTEMLQRDAEILRRKYYFGQSSVEIAEAMGMTANYVGVALNRAQKRMHNKLCLRYPGMFE